MQIERIEDWAGQDVLDSDGEKIGKLEDVYYEHTGAEAVLACVKSGLLGRKLHVVPLAGAQATRDHIRLAYTKAQVDDGPRVAAGEDLADGRRQAIASHFGTDLAAGDFESAQRRQEREALAQNLKAEINDLEAKAAEKRDEAKEGQNQAQESSREAQALEAERRRLEQESRRLN